MMITEEGMDPAVYGNETLFDKKIRPQIEKSVEKELGYEKAHTAVVQDYIDENVSINSLIEVTDVHMITPIDKAIAEEYDKFLLAKRKIVKREYIAQNKLFIEENVKNIDEREIIFKSNYASIIAVEATKGEIENYANLDTVEQIFLYTKEICQPEVNIALSQIGVYCDGGTGYDGDNWVAQNGFGVKIGIIEPLGRYDGTATQLASNRRLSFVENIKEDGTPISYTVTDHVTLVTSIIAGCEVTVNSKVYKGVASSATVYQMPTEYFEDTLRGIEIFADMGVNVINYSAGSDMGLLYSAGEKAIDMLIANTGIVFVTSAGNGVNITRPGKALNVITVGNANTIGSNLTALLSPFSMHSAWSSYAEASFLPNKPDIAAPGTNISIIKDGNTVYTRSGTSCAAPIVVGVIAQMMTESPSLKGNPTDVKAALLLGANFSKISKQDNELSGNYLRDKSGAGLVDSLYALNKEISSDRITLIPEDEISSDNFYLRKGQSLRAVMVFDKRNDLTITSESEMDNIDLYLKYNSSDAYVVSSESIRNNVEIIEYTVTNTGYYSFYVVPYQLADRAEPPRVTIAYRIFD